MSMNEFLAQFYGTNAASDTTEKVASAAEQAAEEEKIATFAKIAKDNGIDISQYSDEQIEQLYQSTFAETPEKTAGELPPQFAKKDDGDKGEKKKDEKKEEEEKKASAEAAEKAAFEKQASEADFMGRVMAHAYVNEMRKIASAAEENAAKTASVRDRLLKLAEKEEKPEEKKEEAKGGDKDKGDKPLPPWMKDKAASANLDNQAVEQAVALVQEYNKTASANGAEVIDVKVAAERLAAVHTLGLHDSEKVASVQNAEQASYVRALEYLEAAGYPVNWEV